MKSDDNMNRDIFFKELTNLSIEQIQEYIKNNGKGPKVLQLVSWYKDKK